MTASLTNAERCILEVAETAARQAPRPEELTAIVRRRTMSSVTGDEFRQAVASLTDRRLLKAHVTTKAGGAVGRVVIQGVTVLGQMVIGRRRSRGKPPQIRRARSG